jgi:hypothetical protein
MNATATSAQTASPKQVKFVTDLYTEYRELTQKTAAFISLSDAEKEIVLNTIDNVIPLLAEWPRPKLSRHIDSMLANVKSLRAQVRQFDTKPAPTATELESGIYLACDDEIYKVYRGQSGRMLAKVLVVDVHGDAAHGIQGEAHFEYVGMANRFVKSDQRMTLEQAKGYGAIYGVCCVCSATLTDETSIAAGIGPVCGKRVS